MTIVDADRKVSGASGLEPRLPIISVKNVSKSYGRTKALDNVTLQVAPGEQFALLGPNGAGKTTLIHILTTILRPDSGWVAVAGINVGKHPRQARRRIGVVFQEPSLDDRLTVAENLNFHGLVYGVPTALRKRRAQELLALVELTDWRESLVRTLSSGMKRRLEIARALIHDANILFLDEPTVGLDAQTRQRLWEYLRRLKSERDLTLFITTHYIEEVETCDRVCIVDRGQILGVDTPAALKRQHGIETIRVVADSAATAQAISAQYPEAAASDGEMVTLRSREGLSSALLAKYGSSLRSFVVERPSLESVFLSLTGRQMRDQAAGARERTYAFGMRGGEHTR